MPRGHFDDLAASRRTIAATSCGSDPAVGVAQHDAVSASIGGGPHDLKRVVAVGLVAVEEVLGVEEDRIDLGLEVGDRVAHHPHVLFERRLQRLGDVHVPRLAEDAQRLAAGRHHRVETGVVLGRYVLATRRAERRDHGLLELELADALEELDVLGVGAREPALDVAHAEQIELGRDAQLVLDRERHAPRAACRHAG